MSRLDPVESGPMINTWPPPGYSKRRDSRRYAPGVSLVAAAQGTVDFPNTGLVYIFQSDGWTEVGDMKGTYWYCDEFPGVRVAYNGQFKANSDKGLRQEPAQPVRYALASVHLFQTLRLAL